MAIKVLMKIIRKIPNWKIFYQQNLIKIFHNMSWLFFDKALNMGAALFLGVWIARYLGPTQFGLLNYAIAFVALFSAISSLGLPSVAVNSLVKFPDKKELILGTILILQLIGGIFFYVLTIAAVYLLSSDDREVRILVAIIGTLMLFKFSDVASYWFESQIKSKYSVWVKNGVFIIFSGVRVLLILNDAPLIAFAWVMAAEALATGFFMLTALDIYGLKLFKLRVNFLQAKKLLKDSWPLMLSSVAIIFYMKVDQIMLGQMIGNEAVGLYSVAARLSEVWYFIPGIIVSSVFPAIARNHKKNRKKYLTRLQYLYKVLIWLAIAVAIVVTIFSKAIIEITFGIAYIDAASILTWHIWGGVFVFFGSAWSMWIVLEGYQKTALWLHILSLLANIALNLILIPMYGGVGAAIATVISYGLGHTLFMNFFVNQRLAVMMFWKCFSIQIRNL